MLKTKFKLQLGILGRGIQDTIPSLNTLSFFRIPSIRTTLKDIIIINGIVIIATTTYEFGVFPVIKLLIGEGREYRALVYFQWLTWTIPFCYLICGVLNVIYWQRISQDLPGGLKLPIEPSDPNENFIDSLQKISRNISKAINNSFFRLLLIPGLLAQEFVLSFIPWASIRYPIQILSGSLMNAFYAFEYDWNKSGLTLDKQIVFFENNWTYFLGFGLPLTIMLQLIPPLYTAQAFAILLPSFVIFSTQSKIFEPQTIQPYRLPYFWLAKRLPVLTACLCKRKLKKHADTPESKPAQAPIETQTNQVTRLLNVNNSLFTDTPENNTIAIKQPILYSRDINNTPQIFLSEDEQKMRRNTQNMNDKEATIKAKHMASSKTTISNLKPPIRLRVTSMSPIIEME